MFEHGAPTIGVKITDYISPSTAIEDFATLLSLSLNAADFESVLAQKGEIAAPPYNNKHKTFESVAEKKLQLEDWYKEAKIQAELTDDPHAQAPHLRTMAYLSLRLARIETDDSHKLDYLRQSYTLAVHSLILQGEAADPAYIRQGLNLAVGIALRISRLVDPQENIQWLQNIYYLDREIADLAMKKGNTQESYNFRRYSIAAAGDLANLDPDNRIFWERQRLDSEIAYADYAASIDDCFYANNIYQSAIQTIDTLLTMCKTPEAKEERKELLRTKVQIQTQRALINQKSGKLQLASISFSQAAQTLDQLSMAADKTEKAQIAVRQHDCNIAMAETALQVKDYIRADHGYDFAARLSEEIARNTADPQEQLMWFRRCYEERIKSAQSAIHTAELRRAGNILGLAAKTAQQIQTNNPEDQRDWARRAIEANLLAGKIWEKLDETSKAKRSYWIAQNIERKL